MRINYPALAGMLLLLHPPSNLKSHPLQKSRFQNEGKNEETGYNDNGPISHSAADKKWVSKGKKEWVNRVRKVARVQCNDHLFSFSASDLHCNSPLTS